MAFVATPAPGAVCPCAPNSVLVPVPTLSVPCDGQNILSAPISTVYKTPLLNRMRAIPVHGGQQAIVKWQMHDGNGTPVDLTECLDCPASEPISVSLGSSEQSLGSACRAPYALKLRVRENISVGRSSYDPARFEVPAYISDAATGEVRAVLTKQHTNEPGVYFAELALVGEDDAGLEYVLFANTFYLYIDRSMWSHRGPSGPPSLAEIRLHLRDSGGSENFLLDNLKFDVAEIAMAASRCVAYWNEIPPDIRSYNTQTFPYRYHWLEGICAQLFMMVAEQFRSNNLQYSAAGVSVNDQDKEQVYERAAAARQEVWTTFVRRKKSELNLEAGYGEVGSPYFYAGYGHPGR